MVHRGRVLSIGDVSDPKPDSDAVQFTESEITLSGCRSTTTHIGRDHQHLSLQDAMTQT